MAGRRRKQTKRNRKKGTVNRNIKSTLFWKIFGSPENKKFALELYNALNNTNYTDENLLRITTIETTVTMGYHNDVSFVLEGIMSFWEHQSTINPNMAVRFLLYHADVLSDWISEMHLNLLSTKKIEIPAPRFIVFYNGRRPYPEISVQKLSDHFPQGKYGDAEYTVTVFNINYGENSELMNKCRSLAQYSKFIRDLRQGIDDGYSGEEAVNRAINMMDTDSPIRETVMRNRSKIRDILCEWDPEETYALWKKELTEEWKAEFMEEWKKEFMRGLESEAIEKGKRIGFESGFENGEKIGFENGEKIGFENGEKQLTRSIINYYVHGLKSKLPAETVIGMAAEIFQKSEAEIRKIIFPPVLSK